MCIHVHVHVSWEWCTCTCTEWVNYRDCDNLSVVTWWERKWWAKHQGEQVGNLECSVNFTVNRPTLWCTWMNAHLKVNKSTRNQTKAVQGSQSLSLSLSLSHTFSLISPSFSSINVCISLCSRGTSLSMSFVLLSSSSILMACCRSRFVPERTLFSSLDRSSWLRQSRRTFCKFSCSRLRSS